MFLKPISSLTATARVTMPNFPYLFRVHRTRDTVVHRFWYNDKHLFFRKASWESV
jgi:hypothetical protein